MMRVRGSGLWCGQWRTTVFLLGAGFFLNHIGVDQAIAETGGTGGADFGNNLICPTGQYMVGATGSTGWYVDEITVHCAPIGPDGLFAADPAQQGTAGEPGAAPYEQLCANGSVVTTITGKSGIYVDSLAVTCGPLDGDPATTHSAVGGQGGTVEYTEACNAGQGEVANGITGRAGWWIDSLEISCAPLCVPPPAEVTLVSPPDSAIAQTVQPTFRWDVGFESTIGTVYELCVSPPNTNDCSILYEPSLTSTEFTPQQPIDFQGNPFVIWQVRARAGAACDEASPFSEERVLGAPTTPAPPTTVATVDYRPLCAVYKDSRCANCHNDGQFPPDHGEPPPGQGCTFCHDEAIHPETDQAVWVMAPNDQRFSDPATCGDICRTVRQWALDHQGNEHDFFFHVTLDPLIAWGFEPEAILSNPVLPGVEEMTHTQYASLSTQWARDGYPCNEVTDDFPNAGDAVAAAGGGRVELPPGFDAKPPIVDPPAVKDTIWWLDPSIPKADVANLLARRGVPPECRRLIVRDRFGLSKQRLRADQLRLREADLKKICQKLMGEFGDRAR